jgi:hypothetical protein
MLLKWDAAGECRQSATLAASEWVLRNRSSYSAEIDRWSPQRPPVAAEPAAYDIQVVHSGPLSSARCRGVCGSTAMIATRCSRNESSAQLCEPSLVQLSELIVRTVASSVIS